MAEYRTLLEQEERRYGLPPGGFDRLLRRRDRKRRTRQIGALVFTLVLVVAAIGGTVVVSGSSDPGVPADEPSPPPPTEGAPPSALEGYTRTTFTEGGILDPGSSVRSMAVAADGTLWAVPWWPHDRSSAIGSFDGETWTTYGQAEGVPSGNRRMAFSVDIAPDGSVWTGTTEGVARFDGETWTTWGREDGLPSDLIVEVRATHDGTIWAAWPGGIGRFDGSTWTTWNDVPGARGVLSFTTSLALGPDGTVLSYLGTGRTGGPGWGGLLRGGLARFDGSGWILVDEWTWPGQTFDTPRIAVGPDGAVWLAATLEDDRPGTFRTEVSRYDGSAWTKYATEDGLVPGPIWWATFAPDGRLWIGTVDEEIATGLSSFDGRTWTRDVIGDVFAFVAAPDGTLWAGVGTGLVRFTPA